ncbi:choice-of-anchor D domain-containing protein [Nostoc sp. PA-18-2419]|uniref:choice-of-anchor D domain-containing protein n=1 Tax=Nostoc sp. PA-18-2419 TaxID=2575443 RepID=UPI001109F42F|nr:choice-of-anchor D domain-containing protein [Nostoc sp. PA-18-2419]
MAGKVYYVSGTGNDSNNGLKETSAFRTLQKAADLVKAGDTVYVMNGTYEQSKYPNNPVLGINQKHGTSSAPITFTAYPGHNPVIKSTNFQAINIVGSSYIVIEGLTMVGANDQITLKYAQSQESNKLNPLTNGAGIYIQPDKQNNISHHIVVRNNTISKFGSSGIGSKEADYLTIEGNTVSETSWYSPWGTSGISTLNNHNLDNNTTDYKIIIRNNTVYDNYTYIPWWESPNGKATEGHGIMIDSADSLGLDKKAYTGKTLIANNIAYNNGGAGIQVFKSSNVDVVNNTTYQNSQHPDLQDAGEILISGPSTNVNVVNNIMYAKNNGQSYVVGGSTKNIKADHNLIYNTNNYNKTGTNLILGKDPQFVDAVTGNFALKPGSVAIDGGSNAFNKITGNTPYDGDGNGIAVIDIGAYEASTIKIPTPEIQVLDGKVDIIDGSTTAINFGEAIVGNTLTKTFTINNIGAAALNLSNLELPDGFSLVGTLPTSVAVNASTNITVALNTTTPGTYSGSLILSNNDSNESAFDFAIGATVKPVPTPEIQVLNGKVDIADGSTTAINFGKATVGNTLTKTFTIKNTGTAALNLSKLELPDGFSLVGTLPTSVAVNASTNITVALNTTTPGTYSGSLILSNNDSNESAFDFAISGTVKPAPTPEIQVLDGKVDIVDGSTTAINFGEAIVGNTLTKTFTIKNTGTAALNLSNLKLPDGFSLVGTLPTSVAANASTKITVALNTTTPGSYGGSLILSNNDSNESPFDFAIGGTVKSAPTPEIQVLDGKVDIVDGSTTAINFGEAIVGNTLTKTFTIKNTGTAALNLSNLKLPDGFSLVGTLPTSVAANASTKITVALNTTTPGSYGGSLVLSNNDSNESPFDFAIGGTVKSAPTPEIQVLDGKVDIIDGSTTAINFGEAIVGNTLTKTFTINNIGTAALSLSNLKLPDGFSLVGTLPTSVAANASAKITVALNTTTPGSYGGSLVLSNNDSNESPFDFAIGGTVKPAPTPEIQVLDGKVDIADGSTTAINFGEAIVGNTLTKTFTINNIGTAALSLSNLKLPDGFSLVGTLPTSVAANASTNITVALNTTTPGTYSGSLVLSNNDSNESPFDFAIGGTVKPAPTPEIQVLNGTEGSEYLKGNASANKIYGFGGKDTIVGNRGNDQLWGGEGQDTLWGQDGDDLLYGDSGNDHLWGDNGNDTLFGGIGDDQLYGRAGDDWLYGGKGNDALTGGYGADTFVLALGEGTDSILDFEVNKDKIALSGGLQFGQLLIQQKGSQALIVDSLENQVLAKLDNVNASTLLAQSSTIFMTI